MAFNSQSAWYGKLKSFIPAWIFELETQTKVPAVYNGVAKVLSEGDERQDYFLSQTFILQEQEPYLDLQGFERGVIRGVGEGDAAYAARIQSLQNTSNIPALKAAIEAILIVGCAKVVDNETDQPYWDREFFFDRAFDCTSYIRNFFTIWINPQVTGELDFMFDVEEFFDREAFFSSFPLTEQDYVYRAIIDLVDKEKALGTMYQVLITDQSLC